MSDKSIARESLGPVNRDITQQVSAAKIKVIEGALQGAKRHLFRLTEIFRKPKSREESKTKGVDQSKRKLLIRGAAAGAVAIDAMSGGNIFIKRAVDFLLPESEVIAQTSESSELPNTEVPTPITVSERVAKQAEEAGKIEVVRAEQPERVAIQERRELKPIEPPVSKPEPTREVKPMPVEKPVEERGSVSIESFIDPAELKKSAEFRRITDELVDLYTFRAEIEGKKFKVSLPFAEVGEGYNFPVFNYPDGGISSKMRPEVAQERFQEAIRSGNFEEIYKRKLSEYNSIDPKKLSPNDKLAYNNLGEEQHLNSGEKYAFYNALRELGIYGDCNGTAYNALGFVYDKLQGKRGSFDDLTKRVFPDLVRLNHPVAGFNINRFGFNKWATEIESPKVKDFKAGDIIALGKEQHTLLVVGWDPEKKALTLMQNTDETRKVQGLDLLNVYIINPEASIQHQKWEAALAEDTTLVGHRGGERYQSRLDEPIGGSGKQYKVFRNLELQKELDSIAES